MSDVCYEICGDGLAFHSSGVACEDGICMTETDAQARARSKEATSVRVEYPHGQISALRSVAIELTWASFNATMVIHLELKYRQSPGRRRLQSRLQSGIRLGMVQWNSDQPGQVLRSLR